MPDELTLLPQSTAKRHPARGLAASIGLHIAVVLALTLHLPFHIKAHGPVRRPVPPPDNVRMVVLMPPPMSSAKPADTATPPASTPPETAPRAGQPAVDTQVTPPPARFLEQALRLRQQGKSTPAYAIEDLSTDILRAFVQNGWGRIIIGRPPFADGVEVSGWSEGAPSVVQPIGEELRRDLISPRALRLPPGFASSLAGRGKIPAGAEAYLLVMRAVDAALLACQLAAIENARLVADNVAVTVGRFAVSGSAFNGLTVTEFELVDGRTIRSKS